MLFNNSSEHLEDDDDDDDADVDDSLVPNRNENQEAGSDSSPSPKIKHHLKVNHSTRQDYQRSKEVMLIQESPKLYIRSFLIDGGKPERIYNQMH